MKITPEIMEALQRAVSKFPNRNQFALMVGIPQHTLARWLDGISKSISDENYEKLFPIIRPHFKEMMDTNSSRRLRGYLVKINDEFATALIERPDCPGVFDEVELKRIG